MPLVTRKAVNDAIVDTAKQGKRNTIFGVVGIIGVTITVISFIISQLS